MVIKSVGRLPQPWQGAAGVALVTVLAVAGAYVEANPVQRYGGLDLTRHPPLAAYLLLAVPALALIWRNSRPVEVLGLAVGGAVGWGALGQIDGAALVPVIPCSHRRTRMGPGLRHVAMPAGPGPAPDTRRAARDGAPVRRGSSVGGMRGPAGWLSRVWRTREQRPGGDRRR